MRDDPAACGPVRESMNVTVPFLKMNGLGNEILVVDLRQGGEALSADIVRLWGAPGHPLHFDQLMALHPGRDGADADMRIYNCDGSESSACGNGTRCVAAFLMAESGRRALVLDSAAGRLMTTAGERLDQITVDMGAPRFGWAEIPLAHAVDDTRAVPFDLPGSGLPATFSAVSMGNPHAIFFVPDLDAFDLAVVGPRVEHHPLFPQKVNLSLVRVDSPVAVTMKVWERGAGATLACGTAACAIAAAGARAGLTGRRVAVTLPGGVLHLDWRESDGHMLMTGPAAHEFAGRLDPLTGAFRRTAEAA